MTLEKKRKLWSPRYFRRRQCCSKDIFWLKDESIEDSENLPDPKVIAQDIAENLQTALSQFNSIYEDLGG